MKSEKEFDDILKNKFSEVNFDFDKANWKKAEADIDAFRKEEADFDDILRNKYENEQFTFDERNWEKAEAQIIALRKKERNRKVAFIFFTGLIIGLLISLPFVNNWSENNEPIVASKSKEISPKVKETSSTVRANSMNKRIDTSTNNNQGILSDEENEALKEKNSIQGLPLIAQHKNEKSSSTSDSNPQPELNTKPKKAFPNAPIKREESEINKTETPKEKFKPLLKVDSLNAEITTLKDTVINSVTNDSLAITVLNDSIISADSTSTADSTKTVVAEVDTTKKKPTGNEKLTKPPYYVLGSVGGNYVKGFSFNPFQGGEIAFPLSQQWAIGTGFYYTLLTINTGAVKTIVTEESYDFGRTAQITEIKTNRIHYATIPLFGAYQVNEKNTIIAGINQFALITVSND